MVNPLPEGLIREFASKVERLVVIEELDPVIEGQVKAMGISVEGKNLFPVTGEFSQKLIAEVLGAPLPTPAAETPEALPVRPPVMCAGCPHRGLFYVLAKKKLTVLGDIGCYTLGSAPPLTALDSTLCMGASVSGLHGFNKVLGKESEGKTVSVIGDSTFMHSGMTGLVNVAYNGSNSTVIILDNSITGMTGHQQNPTTGYNIKGDPAAKVDLETLCHAIGIRRVRVVDPYDLAGCEEAVTEELAGGGAVGDHLPPSLRAAEICEGEAAGVCGSRKMPGVQALHEAGMPRDPHTGREGEHRHHALRRLRRMRAALPFRRHRRRPGRRVRESVKGGNGMTGTGTKSVMIVGVGGQGSLLASKLLGRLLIGEGYQVKVSEVHGMSQRGGSVVTYVKFGDAVYSPVVAEGEADFIVSFEALEAARWVSHLKKGGRIVVNSQQIDPMPVITGAAEYPAGILDDLRAKGCCGGRDRRA